MRTRDQNQKTAKAVVLLSGGLDSTLAARVIQEQGIELTALNFKTQFCLCDRHGSCAHQAGRVARELGIEVRTIFLGEEYLEMLKNPRHGYGRRMNPCLDCRIMMFKLAGRAARSAGADFIVTGEVLGQRPMSQRLAAMKLIEKESGLEGLVLRPLSSRLLPPTIPERRGWVDRERLFAVQGRSRKGQISLAAGYGISDYPCAAGGCLLTDPGFSRRMEDLIRHKPDFGPADVELLKVGRHFRLNRRTRLVVGRNQNENARLLQLSEKIPGVLFMPLEVAGPTGLKPGKAEDDGTIELSCRIVARYCDAGAGRLRIGYRLPFRRETEETVAGRADQALVEELRVN